MTTTTARILSPLGSLATLSILERDDWNKGHVVLFDRQCWNHAKLRPELARPGVYVLVGGRTAYVGEGDPVLERLRTHNQARDFWTRAIALTSLNGELNKAHVQFLEARLCAMLAAIYDLENKVVPLPPTLSEFDQIWADQALSVAEDALRLLGVLLTDCFGQASRPPVGPARNVCPSPTENAPQQICDAILDMPAAKGFTVRRIVQLCGDGQPEFAKCLEPLGLKWASGRGLQVAPPAHAVKVSALFANSIFCKGAWYQQLRRLPGVLNVNPRFHGKQVNSLCIPLDLLDR